MSGASIPLEREPHPEPPLERCCFCRTPTTMWTLLPGRTLGGQVACCEPCASIHKPADVPTKQAWCEKERALTPTRGRW